MYCFTLSLARKKPGVFSKSLCLYESQYSFLQKFFKICSEQRSLRPLYSIYIQRKQSFSLYLKGKLFSNISKEKFTLEFKKMLLFSSCVVIMLPEGLLGKAKGLFLLIITITQKMYTVEN